jgi:hypothetical protein
MVLLPPDRWRAGPSGAAHADSRLLPWQQQPEAAGRVVVIDGRYGAAESPLLVPLPGAWMGGGSHLEPQFISEPAAQFDGATRDGAGAGAGAHFEAAAAAPAFIDFLGVGAT